ncbi:ADP-ribosylglycohydrolase family protein [Ruficoccus sp. ZRK36]|uniref:ADP-ribosylglycohydrolase family protein n=1 Tax=Ruficoccus sp. ZRK36 TaxID=2866311 RepID=UPI001C7305AB|nr:ADP-ribosylglycohydrolase family protein [Ruficoccus sp. ZRK36]QYY35368.1 ADP-ribosylglycohydrolase family protein [Ruficoccus sp. ZRK36]
MNCLVSAKTPSRLATPEQLEAGLLGMLIGDAVGVPYEFRMPQELPPFDQIDMEPPKGFLRTYSHVPTGTWSDDGAQALCLLASLQECGYYHAFDFSKRLIKWHDFGYMAVDNYAFDIGNQTSVALARLKKGVSTSHSGLTGVRNNGNGSLMRCLPLALQHLGNDLALVLDAHRQSRLTHRHPRSQVCCALYCLWARREMQRHPDPWGDAVTTLRMIYAADPVSSKELEEQICPDEPPTGTGTGYVVDCLNSARLACEEDNYETIIKKAVSLGNDTDTTAAVAGGIAGVRYGVEDIPERWIKGLRGKHILAELGLVLED